MTCTQCGKNMYVGAAAFKGQYSGKPYCDKCAKNNHTDGNNYVVVADGYGNFSLLNVPPVTVVPALPPFTSTPACTHPKFDPVTRTCPDCFIQIEYDDKCNGCQHEYRRHNNGIKGRCLNCTTCQGFEYKANIVKNIQKLVAALNAGYQSPGSSGIPLPSLDLEIGFHPTAIKDSKASTKEQRKKDGLCLECGDKGEVKAMAWFCRNGHGKIF